MLYGLWSAEKECLLCREIMGGLVNKMIFQPPPSTYTCDVPDLLWLPREGSSLPIAAFFLPSPDAEYTILFSHGNAEDLGCVYEWIQEMSYNLKVNVMAYDYAGYGQSGGAPDEESAFHSIDAAFHYLTDQLGIPPHRIIVWGRSLGGGPSCELALKTPDLAGLVLQCTFCSVLRVIFGPGRRLDPPGDIFANYAKLPHIQCPVLVVHGRRDEVIPFTHGEMLAKAAAKPVTPLWISEAGHNNIEIYWKISFLNRITSFISEIRSFQAKKELQQCEQQRAELKSEFQAMDNSKEDTSIDLDNIDHDDATLASLTALIQQKNADLCVAQQALLNKSPKNRKDLNAKVKALDLELQVLSSKRQLAQEKRLAASCAGQSAPLLDRKDDENRLVEEEPPPELEDRVGTKENTESAESAESTEENKLVVVEEECEAEQGEDSSSAIAPASS